MIDLVSTMFNDKFVITYFKDEEYTTIPPQLHLAC